MGIFNMFTISKVSPNDQLCLVEEYKKTVIRSVNDIHDFYLQILNQDPSRYLIITGSLNNRFIPIIDCDSVADYEQTIQHLDKKEVRRTVFLSSHNHYWVIPDLTFSSFESAWRAICFVPGNDHKYLKFTWDRGYFCIRGECKENKDPPQLTYTNCVEPNIQKFTELVVQHFSDERMKTIANVKAKRLLEIQQKQEKTKREVVSWY